jgi:transposase
LHSPALHSALDAVAGLELKGTIDTAKGQNQRALGDEPLSDYEQRYTAILQAGVEEAGKEVPPASGSRDPKTQSKSQNRLDRLGGYRKETLAFMKDVAVPLDPHRAERGLWMIKVKQKVSGCFRTPTGAHAFCRIRSYLSTMKKHGQKGGARLSRVSF